MTDEIDAAIAQAEASDLPGSTLWQVTLGKSSGRVFAVGMWDDATEQELAELAAWLLTTATAQQRRYHLERAKPTLVLARHMPKA